MKPASAFKHLATRIDQTRTEHRNPFALIIEQQWHLQQ
jgi:hypothetical protein